MRLGAVLLPLLIVVTLLSAQTPGPTFEVVSIKRNTGNDLGSRVNNRPDGGFTMTNIPVTTLIARAYPPAVPADMIGLPDWAGTERYDVSATSRLDRATPDDVLAMMRAMLAERFQLVTHVESREDDVFALMLARSDGRLGDRIAPSAVDCIAKAEADRAAAAAGAPPSPPAAVLPDFNASPPPCSVRMTGPRMEGDMTMERLAMFLRPAAGRWVVDKTGLSGSYRLTLEFDRMASLRDPSATPEPNAPPSVFSAVQEQLGLKLVPSRAMRERLVIDRLERPTEN